MNLISHPNFLIFFSGNSRQTEIVTNVMADFDAIYQDQVEEGSAILEETHAALVPDPVIVRGAGNITV
jgi:hypothetical protein